MSRQRPRLGGWLVPLLVAAAVVTTLTLPGAGPARAQDDGDVESGQQVYRRHCAMCHGSDGEGMANMHPAVRGAIDRLTREGAEVTIRNGRETTPPMPSFADRLSDAEIDAVLAYIDSLPTGSADAGPGRMDDGDGMGEGMMDDGMGDMMDDNDTVLWVVIVVLAALAAGLGGYLLAQRRR